MSRYRVNIFTGKHDEGGNAITRKGSLVELAKLVATSCSKGLCSGLGDGTGKPGTMCVEAAVNYAMTGDASEDHPECVKTALADFKIDLNDWDGWKGKKQRGKALQRIAIAQLGTYSEEYELDWHDFSDTLRTKVMQYVVNTYPQLTYEQIVNLVGDTHYTVDSEFITESVRYLKDHVPKKVSELRLMRDLIECAVQALIELKTPGSTYLYLVK